MGIIFILVFLGWIFLGVMLKFWGVKIDKIDLVIVMGVFAFLFILFVNY